MDEFPELLSRDFGFRPQGKAAPMATARGSGRSPSGSVPLPSFTSSASGSAKSRRESPLSDETADKGIAGLGGSSARDYGGGIGDLDGFLAGGGGSSWKSKSAHNSSSFDYDSMLDSLKDPVPLKATPVSGPVFDTPIYDEDDMFDGVPGLKTSSAGKFDDVFASLSSTSNQRTRPQDDDLLGDLSGKEHISDNSGRKQSGGVEQAASGFDDLIPGFGGGGSPQNRAYSGTNHQGLSSQPNKSTTSVATDPFADLESTSAQSYPSAGSFVDPLDSIGVSSGNTKFNASNGLFDDVNSFKGSNKSTPFFPSDEDIAKTSDQIKQTHPTAAKETPANSFADDKPTKVAGETHGEPEPVNFGIPNTKSDFEINSKQHPHEDEDVWLTVSEIPLFTQPISAPPPSRPPPPFSRRKSTFAHANRSESANADVNNMANASVPNYKLNYTFSESFTDSSKTFGVSSVDELEDFAMGKSQMCAEEQPGVISSEEDNETSSAAATSAAAMQDAMYKAEAKIKQARELRERERETRTTQNREFSHQVKKDKIASDFHKLETVENLEDFDPEKERREREEKEKERRRLEREREKAIVEKTLREARQRAAAEARERAAAEAKQKAERAAVEKANAEARGRAARAAVNRATAEARERAAAEARERVAAEARERAAAEARERAAREAREREVREREVRERELREREAREREAREREARMTRESQRAAVQRAAADARQRAERAAVEKANREARERAAAAAATASAREKQHKSENDLDSVFGMGSRATSEPKHRPVTPDFSFDGQVPSKGGSTGARNASSATSSSSMRKTSSVNFLDDLTSVFGAPPSSGEFQEIDGETEERRRARLERHQRTLERAAKALAEKNQRDMQVQREQAEKDRIAERMGVEIKRWAAGKEGNLRALLSTLQYVLWPECGWQAVSLTDLITAASVKKVYRKATLHLHPDKVQQKGANLEQKIIAEKVFDLLKEAWNKFNSEELF